MADKTRSVGVLITTNLEEKRVAVLQIRGCFNTEKMKPESWIGLCQVTAAGKLREGESHIDGALREVNEELGGYVSGMVRGQMGFRGHAICITETDVGDQGRKTYHFFFQDPSFLKWIRLGPSSGGLMLVDNDVEIHVTGKEHNKSSVFNPNEKVTMFRDESDAVLKALFEYDD